MNTDVMDMKRTAVAALVLAAGVTIPNTGMLASLASGSGRTGQHSTAGHALAKKARDGKPGAAALPIIATLPRSFSVNNDPATAAGAPATTRWDACTAIHWQINLAGAPRGALADARGAIARLSKASGLAFTYDGTTTVTPDGDFGSNGDATQTYPPLTIAFPTPGSTQNLPAYAAGVGGWHAVMVSPDQGQTWVPRIVAGFVLVDRNQARHMKTGFGTGGTTGELLLHELGHVVGLGHVGDPTQVMYPTITTKRAAYGKGDLTGLRQVGAQAGCLPQLPPIDGYVTTGP